MSKFPNFEIGQKVTNKDLTEEFKCGNMGGMRRSHKTNTLIIISDHTKELYDDKWIGGTLHYTGMGKKGDQDLYFSQNRTLFESNKNGIGIYLFEVFEPTEYIYQGEIYLAEDPYQEIQKDEDGQKRKVWMFPLKLKSTSKPIDEELLEKNLSRKAKRAKRLAITEIEERAENNGSEKASSRKVTSDVYVRDVYVSEYAKRRAKGVCQLCDKKAPFINKAGDPYLECHHIDWLGEGGSDTIENTVALCPNCHRKMHALNLPSDIEKLKKVAKKR